MTTRHANPQAIHLGLAAEMVFYLLLLACGVLCIDTTVPNAINFMVLEYLDSALYSQVVGVVLVASALYQSIEAIRKRKEAKNVPYTMLVGLVLTTVYILGFTYIGFYVSTFIFLSIYSIIIEQPAERNLKTKLLFSIFSVLILYISFSTFKIFLPTPLLF